MLVEQVVALEPEKTVCQFPFAWPHELLDRDATVVVADPCRHGPEERKRLNVTVPKCLGALTGISPDEHRIGIRQAHHEQRSTVQTVNFLRSRQLAVTSLTASDTQPKGAWGRLFWDRDRHVWHFCTSGMTLLDKDETYELWIITANQEKVPAGTFDVDASGEATLVVNLPEGVDPIVMVAVTDEPAGGVPQPTGSIPLAGGIN